MGVGMFVTEAHRLLAGVYPVKSWPSAHTNHDGLKLRSPRRHTSTRAGGSATSHPGGRAPLCARASLEWVARSLTVCAALDTAPATGST